VPASNRRFECSYLRDLRARGVAAVGAAAMPANYTKQTKRYLTSHGARACLSQIKEMSHRRNMHTTVRTLDRSGAHRCVTSGDDSCRHTYSVRRDGVQSGIAFRATQPKRSQQELTNPVSNVWSMFTEFDTYFLDGDLIRAVHRSRRMIFQRFCRSLFMGKAGSVETHHPVPTYL